MVRGMTRLHVCGTVSRLDLFSQGGTSVGTVSIVVGIWLLLSFVTTAILASIAARGHARRDDRQEPVAEAR